jgi:hypothetical protein
VVAVLLSDEQAQAPPWRGHVLDRSLGGLCLLAERRAESGTVLTVRPANAPPMMPWIELEVMSCRDEENGWELGCRFVRTPPSGLLLLFG